MYLLSSHYTVPVNLSKLDPKTTVGDFVFNFYNMITKHTPRVYSFKVHNASQYTHTPVKLNPNALIRSNTNSGMKLNVVINEFDEESTESKSCHANNCCHYCGRTQVGSKEYFVGANVPYLNCRKCKTYYPLTI